MAASLGFVLELKSDYHVGAGYGQGVLDSLLQRDGDGLPVLRGTMLAGLFRDALTRLLQTAPMMAMHPPRCRGGLPDAAGSAYCCTLNDGHDKAAECPVCRLLGSPALPKRWSVHSARIQDAQGIGLSGTRSQILDSQPVWRCRVDPRFRRVEPYKLFSSEEGSRELSFRFHVSIDESGPRVLDEAALWVAASRFIRELGRSRRRGLGQCVLRLVEAEGFDIPESSRESDRLQDWFLDRFETSWLTGTPAPPARNAPEAASLPAASRPLSSEEDPVLVRIVLRLDEPLIITERSTAGNQFNTRDSIPGSALRGALAWRARDLTKRDYDRFVQLFLRSNMIFSPLYHGAYKNNHVYPCIPVPLDFRTCKVYPWSGTVEGHGFCSVSLDREIARQCGEAGCGAALGPVNGLIHLMPGKPRLSAVAERSELHIRIDPEKQRVTEGNLYGYSVLDAGQYFVGFLSLKNGSVWESFQSAASIEASRPTTLRLGKALRRGYGLCSLWFETTNVHPWRLVPLEHRVPSPSEPLRLVLMTDSILRDRWGRFIEGFSESWLAESLGLGPIELIRGLSSVRTLDGFNTLTGLPKWRDLALRAGSVAGIRLQQPPEDAMERMRRIELEGIGLRRVEGHGQVVFNPLQYGEYQGPFSPGLRLDPSMLPASPMSQISGGKSSWLQRELPVWLDDEVKREHFGYPQFGPLARWLHHHRQLDPADLKERLRAWGAPPKSLEQALGGRRELGDRTKKSFLEEKGKEGKKRIIAILDFIGQGPEKDRPEAVSMLAERIAGYSRKGA